VQDIINEYAEALPTPHDWCMVNNFKDEYRPRAIAVPPGKAIQFSKKMTKLVEDLNQLKRSRCILTKPEQGFRLFQF
jgi:hypothetical protein